MDVILFVREAFEKLPELRSEMLVTLFATLSLIKATKVLRATLWIIGEYCKDVADIKTAMEKIVECLGKLPIVETEQALLAGEEAEVDKKDDEPKQITRTRVTADGTYATESVYTTPSVSIKEEKPILRKLFLEGDFYLGSVLACCLTKLALRFKFADSPSEKEKNALSAQGRCFVTVTSVLVTCWRDPLVAHRLFLVLSSDAYHGQCAPSWSL